MESRDYKILYVDDEEYNLISFNATFRKEYGIFTATSGVERTHIIDGRAPDSLLVEVFTGAGNGTMIVHRKEKASELDVDLQE